MKTKTFFFLLRTDKMLKNKVALFAVAILTLFFYSDCRRVVSSENPVYTSEKQNYTLSFESNGGSAVSSHTIAFGQIDTAPKAPIQEGYSFEGWFTDNETFSHEYNFNTPVTENITLYANWELSSFIVAFETNEGYKIASQTIKFGDTAVKPSDPMLTGFTFDHWFADESLTNIYNFSTPVTNNLTLYAGWTESTTTTFTVTFNTNGGSSIDDKIVLEGQPISEPVAPIREGYTFLNWYIDPSDPATAYDFTTPVTQAITLYANYWIRVFTLRFNTNGGGSVHSQNIVDGEKANEPQALNRDGYRFLNWYIDPSSPATAYDFTRPITTNTTLHANWMRIFHVRFESNGGSSVSDVIVDSNTTVDQPSPVPTREGYSFLGWFTDDNTFNNDYNVGISAVTRDMTLYANWEAITYRISFETNGGITVASQTINYNGTVTEPETKPTNIEHGGTFEHWYSDEDFMTEYHFSDIVTENLTLYAKWSYMVTYNEATRTITGISPDVSSGDIDLVIPSNINGLMINSISNSAFRYNTRIVSLRIAEGIKHIGDSAFEYSSDVNSRIRGSLVIPNSVKTIGRLAFAHCSAFDGTLTIGNSVETMGDGVFSECSSFTGNLVIPNSIHTIEYYAFSGCSGFNGSLTIPNSVETIRNGAFLGCNGFNGNLTIPNSVRNIANSSFAFCRGFEGDLTIPSSVENIGTFAFCSMTGIDSFIFESNTPPNIGSAIFCNINDANLKIKVPLGSVATYQAVSNFNTTGVSNEDNGANSYDYRDNITASP